MPIKKNNNKYYGNITEGSVDYEADIKIILRRMIAKAMQVNYSAMGRVVRGISKLKWVDSTIYKSIEDIGIF